MVPATADIEGVAPSDAPPSIAAYRGKYSSSNGSEVSGVISSDARNSDDRQDTLIDIRDDDGEASDGHTTSLDAGDADDRQPDADSEHSAQRYAPY